MGSSGHRNKHILVIAKVIVTTTSHVEVNMTFCKHYFFEICDALRIALCKINDELSNNLKFGILLQCLAVRYFISYNL
jgi:hypothetical protein